MPENEFVNGVYDFLKKNTNAARVLNFLICRADENRLVSGISYLYLSDVFDVSLPTITRTIKALKEMGYITVHKDKSCHTYEISEEVYNNFKVE